MFLTGMTEAFGRTVPDPDSFQLLSLVEISMNGAEGDQLLKITIPDSVIEKEPVVLLGFFSDYNVEWCRIQVISVENSDLTAAITAEQVDASKKNEKTVLTVLVKK